MEEQQHHAQRPAIEVDHQAGKHHHRRREAAAPSQGEDQRHGTGATRQGHPFAPGQQQARGEQGGGHQRQVGAAGHAQGGGGGQRVAQHLLHQHPRQGQAAAGQQRHGQARPPAVVAHQRFGALRRYRCQRAQAVKQTILKE